MVLDAGRLWTIAGFVFVARTQGFVHPPSCSARGSHVVGPRSQQSSPPHAALRTSSPPLSRRRARTCDDATALSARWWNPCSGRGLGIGLGAAGAGPLFSAQQSVDGGVMLPPADQAEEYASFLSEAIRQHLDDEWMEQECHEGIGEEVARLYLDAFKNGPSDMTTLVLDVGSAMEKFDMGDAFVGAWDIANLVSDFLMQRMGAETSGCSTKAPTTSPSPATTSSSSGSGGAPAFRLTTEKVDMMQADLTSDFARYRFLLDLMEGNTDWEQANTVMAVYQGYTPEDEEEGQGQQQGGGARLGVRKGWAQVFHGAAGTARLTPPDLSTVDGLVEALEADFPDDPDLLDGLEVIVETVYGGEAKRLHQGDAESGIPPNPMYLRRSTMCKWLYLVGFLADDIKRAPDDPDQLAKLISGRARLKNQTK
ncbi:unnamed protein product [Scytosiphon promiscuus]